MENRNTDSVNIDMGHVTSKTQLNNGDVLKIYSLTNGNIERSGNLTSTHMNNDAHMGSTPSELHHLSPNRRTTLATDNSHSQNGRDLESASNDAEPLLETEMIPKPNPPVAHPELDDDDESDEHIPNTPDNHPGVDDGFFPNDIGPRIGDDDNDGPNKGVVPNVPNGNVPVGRLPDVNNFPYAPGFDPLEGIPHIIPDVNVYQHKKTLAQGMMDLALLSANANQLRYVLESYQRHPYYYFSLVFISLSLILQIAVGVGLILNSRYNVKRDDHICKADKINNFTILGIFLVTIVNVFISAFGVADPAPQIQG